MKKALVEFVKDHFDTFLVTFFIGAFFCVIYSIIIEVAK